MTSYSYINTIKFEGDPTSYNVGLPNLYVNAKGNLCLETSMYSENGKTGYLGGAKKGKINIESISDIQIKPGDDITLYSHHRSETDEVKLKIMNGAGADDVPVKLSVNASGLTLTTKDKVVPGDDEGYREFNVNINTGMPAVDSGGNHWNTKGYLKVRAQAIDLRCEEHGGIALQPKGTDGTGKMNKVKFEHGGGDGAEFFTMNTQKMSAYVTNEYRFNKNAAIKLATRELKQRSNATGIKSDGVTSYYLDSKYDPSDSTANTYYTKQSDDFYDVIDGSDVTLTWGELLDNANYIKTNKPALDLALAGSGSGSGLSIGDVTNAIYSNTYIAWVKTNKDSLDTIISNGTLTDAQKTTLTSATNLFTYISVEGDKGNGVISNIGKTNAKENPANLNIKSGADIILTPGAGKEVVITSGGIASGSSFGNASEADAIIKESLKKTAKNNIKGSLKFVVEGENNATSDFAISGLGTVPAKAAAADAAIVKRFAEFSLTDLAKLFNRIDKLEKTVEVLSAGHTISTVYSLGNVTYSKETLSADAGVFTLTYKVVETISIDGTQAKVSEITLAEVITYTENTESTSKTVSGTINNTTYNISVPYSRTQEGKVEDTPTMPTSQDIPDENGRIYYKIKVDNAATGTTALTAEQIAGAETIEDGIVEGSVLYDIDYYYESEDGITIKISGIDDNNTIYKGTIAEIITGAEGDSWTNNEISTSGLEFVRINNKGTDLTIKTPNTFSISSFKVKGFSNKNKNAGFITSSNATIKNASNEVVSSATFGPNTLNEYTFTAYDSNEDVIIQCGNGDKNDKTAKAVYCNFEFDGIVCATGQDAPFASYYYLGKTTPTVQAVTSNGVQSNTAITSFTTNLGNATGEAPIYFVFPSTWGTPTILDSNNRGAGFEYASTELNLTGYKVYVKTDGNLDGTYTITWA